MEVVNRENVYLFRVKTLVIFGSYVTSNGSVGDVDIALELRRKLDLYDGFEDWNKAADQSRKAAENAGRSFNSYHAWLNWPENQVEFFLKSRKRTLSFHSL